MALARRRGDCGLQLCRGGPPECARFGASAAIVAETALQLEHVLGIPAYLWLDLQSDYELVLAWQAQRERRSA